MAVTRDLLFLKQVGRRFDFYAKMIYTTVGDPETEADQRTTMLNISTELDLSERTNGGAAYFDKVKFLEVMLQSYTRAPGSTNPDGWYMYWAPPGASAQSSGIAVGSMGSTHLMPQAWGWMQGGIVSGDSGYTGNLGIRYVQPGPNGLTANSNSSCFVLIRGELYKG